MTRSMIKIILILSLLLTACGKDQTVLKTGSQESEPVITKEEKTKSIFIEKLKLGMDENEVRSLFGADFALVQNLMERNEAWRYDIGIEAGYQFDDLGIDTVDVEGLKQGKIQQQIFIDWSFDGRLLSASLYMRNEERNGYIVYELLDDNSREETFNPFEEGED
ncbi:hypothetical protein BEP19_06380 [Ammoniphilus oxalaticus]|uniref:Lipoprotein n=1 Tax=Ammoniphilus oxalaticus TaxID=66863 RepID=A0A419SJ33_9BACL|nr:hypothetical protein [Ammoniphilus oxalaticus]RKD24031.1 hypothetical protein BEP19_06380 [Ammoniphilus oxalaticus]